MSVKIAHSYCIAVRTAISTGRYSKTGLSGTFIMDSSMSIKTVCTTRNEYDKLLRYSTLRLLSWLQRSVMLEKVRNVEEFFYKPLILDESVHVKLINYYLNCRHHTIDRETAIISESHQGRFSTRDIASEVILVSSRDKIATFYVGIQTKFGIEYAPLICLSDL